VTPDTPDAGATKYRPVLGLSDDPGEPPTVPARAGTVFDQPEPEALLELTVIVPARDEEQSIGNWGWLMITRRIARRRLREAFRA
jgi:hypothetical protein